MEFFYFTLKLCYVCELVSFFFSCLRAAAMNREHIKSWFTCTLRARKVNYTLGICVMYAFWRLTADLRVIWSRARQCHCMIIVASKNICLWQLLLYYSFWRLQCFFFLFIPLNSIVCAERSWGIFRHFQLVVSFFSLLFHIRPAFT